MTQSRPSRAASSIAALVLTLGAAARAAGQTPAARTPDPETVLVTYHVKAGGEAAFAKILDVQWKTMSELALVGEGPHVLMTRDGAAALPPLDVLEMKLVRPE